jgi:xanthine/uracil/vitamin C permease (AzgA family)
MITPYSVVATSVGISLFLSLIGLGHANRVTELSDSAMTVLLI